MKNYKTLAETIYKRKSVRVFSEKPSENFLDNSIELSGKNTLEMFENEPDADLIKMFDIQPLLDTIRVKVKMLKKKEVRNNRSEYCIAFYSEEKPQHLENIGFIGQQIDLELQSRGLGTCWWGMKKPKKEYKSIDGLECIITMTVGYPLKTERRTYPEGFKRKTIEDILINDITEPSRLIESVRIAPSAVNLQPWLIEKIDNTYNFYLRPAKGIIEKMIDDMRSIDMGIAMAHLMVQAKADGLEVSYKFTNTEQAQSEHTNQNQHNKYNRNNSKYIASIIIS
jgi:nitroreductase